MDRVSPIRSYQFPSLDADRRMSPRDRRSHEQFAREYAEQLLRTRAALLESTK